MSEVNMGDHIAPKSDQLNADDLIAGPRTVTITGVRANAGNAEQPVAISFAGDGGKPYLPCKSMRRVMVYVWGASAAEYVGRSMTLYRDPSVQWGGMEVGGIRISHMSHITNALTMALSATKAKRKPYTVQPLKVAATDPLIATAIEAITLMYSLASDQDEFERAEAKRKEAWPKLSKDEKAAMKAASDAAKTRLIPAQKEQET